MIRVVLLVIDEDVHVRELVLAQAAATNSNIIRNDWPQYDFHKLQVSISWIRLTTLPKTLV